MKLLAEVHLWFWIRWLGVLFLEQNLLLENNVNFVNMSVFIGYMQKKKCMVHLWSQFNFKMLVTWLISIAIIAIYPFIIWEVQSENSV